MNNQGIVIPFHLKNYITPIPVLDYLPYTTDLASAWSTQRVVIEGYLGNLVRLRRDSDNDEEDFGYDTVTGSVDQASIDAWAGVDNVFYVKIYDQQGSNHYTQTTTTLQPTMTSNRSFSNADRMMVLTSSFTQENITIVQRKEATTNTLANNMFSGDSIYSPPYRRFMEQNGTTYMNFYTGYTTSNNYYRLQHLTAQPQDSIIGMGIGGAIGTNFLATNGTKTNNLTPFAFGTPTTYFTSVKPSWLYKTAYAANFKGYVDEKYHFTEMLDDTNYGTVRDYINDKYSVY